ncbi:elongation factor P 5-aminopentanone reductase [Anaeromassilibacillus sp. An200]|uniref:SDR family oxidoreductase n=1 Tax=Candidatus Caccousia stercoris TaxID=2840723 RepID=A0A9D1FS98_9FIRM|nr:SDR family oxidoreductase [Anaeromassilibacillus sp. An200]OUP11928.1 3-oxoacyl-ACP reductase [Anaeromassilibacillus sp. An200]HIS78355.1 SDR family oxidoreductase [Candidatus Caccousia stercoris]
MKTALVTGGSRGIGAAVCRRLAEDGLRVVVHYNQNKGKAEALVRELTEKTGLPHLALPAELAERAQVEELFRLAGPVDVLVNNAGIAQQKLFTDITEDDWRRMFAVDVDGVFRCCQCALPHMIHEKSGCIINIASIWGEIGASCEVHYSAAKAAVIGLTKALAKELGPSHIRVNCVSPGVIDTEMNAMFDEETMRELCESTPLGRIGSPEDIAAAVSFLASDAASFLTGQTLSVNGLFPS